MFIKRYLVGLIVASAAITGCKGADATGPGTGGGGNHGGSTPLYSISAAIPAATYDSINLNRDPSDPVTVLVQVKKDGVPFNSPATATWNGQAVNSVIAQPDSAYNLRVVFGPIPGINKLHIDVGKGAVVLDTTLVDPDWMVRMTPCSDGAEFSVAKVPAPTCFSLSTPTPKRPDIAFRLRAGSAVVDAQAASFPAGTFSPGLNKIYGLLTRASTGQVLAQDTFVAKVTGNPTVTVTVVDPSNKGRPIAGVKVYPWIGGKPADTVSVTDVNGVAVFGGSYLVNASSIGVVADGRGVQYKASVDTLSAGANSITMYLIPCPINSCINLQYLFTPVPGDPDQAPYYNAAVLTNGLSLTAKHGTWTVQISGCTPADSAAIAGRIASSAPYQGRSVVFAPITVQYTGLAASCAKGNFGGPQKIVDGYVQGGFCTLAPGSASNPAVLKVAVDVECIGRGFFALGNTGGSDSVMGFGATPGGFDDPRDTFDWPRMRLMEAVQDYAASLPSAEQLHARAALRNAVRAGVLLGVSQ